MDACSLVGGAIAELAGDSPDELALSGPALALAGAFGTSAPTLEDRASRESTGPARGGVFRKLSPQDKSHQAELVRRIGRGDEQALEALYGLLSDAVYRLALFLTRDVCMAEEVTETTFFQVWRQALRFDPTRGEVVAWVLRIARTRAVDAWRAQGRDPLRDAVDIESEQVEVAEEIVAEDPQLLVSRAQVGASLRGCVRALPAARRLVVSMAFFDGFSQEEISTRLSMPLGTVKSHMRRGLASLRTALELQHA